MYCLRPLQRQTAYNQRYPRLPRGGRGRRQRYICPAKDADALYDAMQRFVELPESWRAEMGRRGREQMEKRFSKDAVVAETMKWLWIING